MQRAGMKKRTDLKNHAKKVLAPLQRCRELSRNVFTFEDKRLATLELEQYATFGPIDQRKNGEKHRQNSNNLF